MLKKYSIYFYVLFFIALAGLNSVISQELYETKFYSGSIAEKYAIMAKLSFEKSKITGSYFYSNRGQSIELNGNIDKDGNFSLKEEIYDVKKGDFVKTGSIRGKIDAAYNSLNGEWSNPIGTKKFSFVLKMIGEVKKKKMEDFEVYVAYPLLSGNKAWDVFNIELVKFINDRYDTLSTRIKNDYKEAEDEDMRTLVKEKYSYTIDCDIQYISDNLLSILIMNYESSGGAHPGMWFSSVNYSKSGGKVTKLKLTDIFKPNVNYLKTVSDLCLADLKKQNASLVVSGDVTDLTENLKNGQIALTMTAKGIRFDFSQYEVASYAEGAFVVIIPFDKMKNILRTDGVMSEFMK